MRSVHPLPRQIDEGGLFGVMIVLVNLLIDILYAYIDPRIRLTR
jgi:ABC-type microcin C transport system permease subunit YejB